MIESACVTRLIQQVAAKEFVYFSNKELLNFALSCIDLTTLEGNNTE